MPTRHRAQKHTYLGLEYEESGNQVPYISDKKSLNMLTNKLCIMAVIPFPNELMWFHIEAKPIWEQNQKNNKHAVIC